MTDPKRRDCLYLKNAPIKIHEILSTNPRDFVDSHDISEPVVSS
jgi:hypothetical protein